MACSTAARGMSNLDLRGSRRAFATVTCTATPISARRQAHLRVQTCWTGTWGCPATSAFEPVRRTATRRDAVRQVTRMGKVSSNGPFTPVVVLVRNQLGTKRFNQLRGKAISLHSQVIKEFGKSIGAESKQVQGLIRLAKSNGDKLGFLS